MNNFNQPYYPGGMVQPFNYQPMYQNIPQNIQPQMQPQMQKIQPTEQFSRLQGKSVDSIDVVKATDVALDGSICYFPLIDGSAIITKQLQTDGTSKITVYKPVEEGTNTPEVKYITEADLKKEINKIDFSEFKDKFKEIDRKIEDLSDDIKKIGKKG